MICISLFLLFKTLVVLTTSSSSQFDHNNDHYYRRKVHAYPLQIADHVKPTLMCSKPITKGDHRDDKVFGERPFLILGSQSNDRNGLGNKLMFSSAAYIFAAMTGRDILIEDDSVYGTACRHMYCGFPFRSEYFPDDYLEVEHPLMKFYEPNHLGKYLLGQLNISIFASIVVDGFNGGDRLWSAFAETHDCARQLSGCDRCFNGYVISQLIPGPAKFPRASDSSLLVGFSNSSDLFRIPFQQMTKPPIVDMAIHLRMEFRGFEHYDNVNSSEYASEVDDWLASHQYKNLNIGLSAQVIKALTTASSNQDVPRNKSFTLYLAADSPAVKNALFSDIQLAVSKANNNNNNNNNTTQLPLTVMMLNVSNLVHIKHHKNMSIESENGFALIFDWYVITMANSLVTWLRSEKRASTYKESAVSVKQYMNYTGRSCDLRINHLTSSSGTALCV